MLIASVKKSTGKSHALSFPVCLSAHWSKSFASKKQSQGPDYGCVVLQVSLSRPLEEVVQSDRVSSARGLSSFEIEYADHLESDLRWDYDSFDIAQERLLTAGRSLRFMDITGLLPLKKSEKTREVFNMMCIPFGDHASAWFDPVSMETVILDEPYDAPSTIKEINDGRQEWLNNKHMNLAILPEGEGIHFPSKCIPHLLCYSLPVLDRIVKSVTNSSPVSRPVFWDSPLEGVGFVNGFVSPGRYAAGVPRVPRKSYI